MLKSLENALNASNSVTLPGFGGLMKMGKSFMFNEFLKFNDGKFSKFLQENQNLNEEDANNKISTFVTEIQSELNSKGSFSLGLIGTLVLIDGKIKLKKVEQLTSKPTIKKAPEKPKPVTKIDVPIKKEAPKKTEEVKRPSLKVEEKKKEKIEHLSTSFTVKEAQEKINILKEKQEIIDFTKGDTRKTIVAALNLKLKSLNKITLTESLETELNILEATKVKKETFKSEKEIPIKEGSVKEVKKQVAKESDILKTVIEKEEFQKVLDKKLTKKEEAKKKAEKSELPAEKKVEKPKSEAKSGNFLKEGTPKKQKNTKEEEDLVALTEGAVKLEKEAKGRKRNKIILWIAIICILSGGGIVGFLKQDTILSWFDTTELIVGNDEQMEEEISISEKENMKESTNNFDEEIDKNTEELTVDKVAEGTVEEEQELVIEEDIVEEIEPIKESSVQVIEKGSYYVIVGSFSKEKNALNLVKSLKKEGFSGTSIIQNGSLKSVTLGVYSTSNEAKKSLKESGKEGWVKKPR